MRKELKERGNKKLTITATIKRFGGKINSYHKRPKWEETVLLVDVKDINGQHLTDHIWMNVGEGIKKLNPQTGDLIQFDARVKSYLKRSGLDYHFENPTKLAIISSDPTLYPEETARKVGSGIEYAKILKKRYLPGSRYLDKATGQIGKLISAKFPSDRIDEYEIEPQNEKIMYTILLETGVEKIRFLEEIEFLEPEVQ